MGLHLIFAVTDLTWLGWTAVVLKVVFGLCMVIFVHELGHFLVAKACGVRCDKFYLGFDFFGLKLCKFQGGETEYGIGIFPLGGYVKMLGQEDNPARLREELERAKAAQESAGGPAPGDSAPAHDGSALPADLESVRAALYDPRSYLAKSVPRRMAIISAGVVMNVLFAYVAAVLALGAGVKDRPCGVGSVVPGNAAWQSNIRPGDRIVEIAGKKVDRFHHLQAGISLGDLSQGVELVVERPGQTEPTRVTVMPDRSGKYPTIGVTNPVTNVLNKHLAAAPGSAAAAATPALVSGDRIVKVGEAPVSGYADLVRQLALVPDRPVRITVERMPGIEGDPDSQDAPRPRQIVVEMAPQPVRRLGLVLEMGPVTAVQKDSPAETAGIRPGDVLKTIDGKAPGDPLTLPERLRRREGEKATLEVVRGENTVALKDVELRRADFFYDSVTAESPVAVPSLGIAYTVRNTVARVIDGSPAAKAEIAPGSVLLHAKVLPPDKETVEREGLGPAMKLLGLTLNAALDQKPNWPFVLSRLQDSLPGTTVELTVQDPGGKKSTMTLAPAPGADWFDPLRGMLLEPETFVRQAGSVGEAAGMGYQETVDSLLLIFRMLGALGSGQVSATELRGPLGIIDVAVQVAAAGTGEFLMFLCVLSANLAVLNFLPIPVLDGGHMVFLAYEGVRGKPPSERVFVTLSYLGLVFILGLVLWVTGLDVGRWLGWG